MQMHKSKLFWLIATGEILFAISVVWLFVTFIRMIFITN